MCWRRSSPSSTPEQRSVPTNFISSFMNCLCLCIFSFDKRKVSILIVKYAVEGTETELSLCSLTIFVRCLACCWCSVVCPFCFSDIRCGIQGGCHWCVLIIYFHVCLSLFTGIFPVCLWSQIWHPQAQPGIPRLNLASPDSSLDRHSCHKLMPVRICAALSSCVPKGITLSTFFSNGWSLPDTAGWGFGNG